jgi:hypothetical protein
MPLILAIVKAEAKKKKCCKTEATLSYRETLSQKKK